MRKNFHFCRNSLSPFSVAAMYFSISILSCTNEMKSLKTNTVLFSVLIYRKYFPSITSWLRVKRCEQGWVSPNKTSDSESLQLTPNHLLLLRANPNLPPGVFTKEDTFCKRRRWQVQYMALIFWNAGSRNIYQLFNWDRNGVVLAVVLQLTIWSWLWIKVFINASGL